jgi:predicted house-cleaning NTP pyrophosphatase (Maf/HAM1 superfamily)
MLKLYAPFCQTIIDEKAQAVLKLFPEAIVIAADTSLGLDGQIIGKPESFHEQTHQCQDYRFQNLSLAVATAPSDEES